MRLMFIFAIVLLLVGTLVGELIVQDPGYVLINFQQTTIETSIWGLALIGIVLFLAGHFGLRFLSYLASRRRKLAGWNRSRAAQRANRLTERGLIALAAGEWSKAQRLLSNAADQSALPLINYLGAAQAAQELNQPEAGEELLNKAMQTNPRAAVAIGLAQVDNHLARNHQEPALSILLRLRRMAPKHTRVLRLLAETYQRVGDWGGLADLIPELRKRNIYPVDTLDRMERETHLARLEAAIHRDQETSQTDQVVRLGQVWNALPKTLRNDAELAERYAGLLMEIGATEQAEKLLRGQLKKTWDARLVALVGKLPADDSGKQLKQARNWLDAHPGDAALLLTLGRLAMRNRDWTQARQYFEQSLSAEYSQDAFNELSRLLLHLEDSEGYQSLLAAHVDRLSAGLPSLPLPLREAPKEAAAEKAEEKKVAPTQDAELEVRGA